MRLFHFTCCRSHAGEESEMAKSSMIRQGLVVTKCAGILQLWRALGRATMDHLFVVVTAFARNLLASSASGRGRAVGCCDDDGL